MGKAMETAKIDLIATQKSLASIKVAPTQNLVRVAQRVQHGALAGTIGPEQQRDGSEVDSNATADPLEVLDLDRRYQRRLSVGTRALAVSGG